MPKFCGAQIFYQTAAGRIRQESDMADKLQQQNIIRAMLKDGATQKQIMQYLHVNAVQIKEAKNEIN
jgi:hypothetical protein